jgi:1-acyl-sn-glycerol-3-phosphate acyltransferase
VPDQDEVRREQRRRRIVAAIDRDPAVIAVAARAARLAIELHGVSILATRMADGSIPLALLVIAETLRISAPTMAEAAFGRLTRAAVDRRLADWSARLLREAAVDLEVHGSEHAGNAGETFVVMSNHQSHFDIPVLYQVFPRCMRMVAKTELYKIPIFGSAVRAAEMIEVDRGNKERARESIALAKERLASGINVWIAPEGTRSTTGKLGSFKKGGFILALDTGARILPITINGTRHVLPPHTARVRKGQHVRVDFHAPIDPRPFSIERRDELVAVVRSTIESALPPELRG